MYKFTLLFPQIAQDQHGHFDAQWTTFRAMAEKMPGIRRIEVDHVQGGPGGRAPYHMAHNFFFDTRPALDAALQSDIGIQAGQFLMKFAPDTTILFSEAFIEADPDSM